MNIKIKHPIPRSAYRMIMELFVICFAAILFCYAFELTQRAQDVTNRNIAVEVIGLMKSKQEGQRHPV